MLLCTFLCIPTGLCSSNGPHRWARTTWLAGLGFCLLAEMGTNHLAHRTRVLFAS